MDMTDFGVFLKKQNLIEFINGTGLTDSEVIEALNEYRRHKELSKMLDKEMARQVAFAFEELERNEG